MKIKYNDATPNRPEGDRILDAPYIRADIKAFTEQVKEEDAWDKSDRNAITLIKTDNATIVLLLMKEGAVMKDNITDDALVVQVLEGKIRIETLEGDIEIDEKNLMAFQPHVPHSIEALSETKLLLSTYSTNKE